MSGIVFFVILGFSVSALAADYTLAWPVSISSGKKSSERMPSNMAYEKRHGTINVASGVLLADSPVMEGDALTVTLFSDVSYQVIIDSVKRNPDGTTVFSGKPVNSELSTFVLTSDSQNFLMTVQDAQKNMTYRVTGNIGQSNGSVTEINKREMPPVIHLPPRIPESSEPMTNK